MGENIKANEQQSTADRLREQIRHTESDITETVHTLEQRVSLSYLRERGTRKAKGLAWQGAAKLLALAQRGSVQASLLGASALWLVIRSRKGKPVAKKRAVPDIEQAGSAAKAVGASALWMLTRKLVMRKLGARKKPGRKVAWRGIATAIGAALGSYWYRHREHRI